jgi:hypothetical protein
MKLNSIKITFYLFLFCTEVQSSFLGRRFAAKAHVACRPIINRIFAPQNAVCKTPAASSDRTAFALASCI